MALIRVPTANTDLTAGQPTTFLNVNTAAGVSSIDVKNISGFADLQILVLGSLGSEGSEIVYVTGTPSGSTITLTGNTVFPHSASTPVTALAYDQIEYSNAITVGGVKGVLATLSILADATYTSYNDVSGSVGYYFVRFHNTVTDNFSTYSSPVPVTGYDILSARSIIDSAVAGINYDDQYPSTVLYDEFAFKEINNCQMEVLREYKSWSWMQKFDANIGDTVIGTWKIPVPTDLDFQNTNASIYNFRIGKEQNLIWVDKEKWNEIIQGIAHSTLALPIVLSDATVTLTDSSDFDDGGVIQIGNVTIAYTANDRTTGILTLQDPATADQVFPADTDTFQGASFGLPIYYTIFGSFLYHYPVIGYSYAQRNYYLDYYKTLTLITTDSEDIVIPDPSVVEYYLEWKFLKKLGNGIGDDSTTGAYNHFVERRDLLKRKETIGRTYRFRPLLNTLDQTGLDEQAARAIRLGNFSDI